MAEDLSKAMGRATLMMHHETRGSTHAESICGDAKGDDISLATTFVDVSGNHVRLLASGTRSARQWILETDKKQTESKLQSEMLFLLERLELEG